MNVPGPGLDSRVAQRFDCELSTRRCLLNCLAFVDYDGCWLHRWCSLASVLEWAVFGRATLAEYSNLKSFSAGNSLFRCHFHC